MKINILILSTNYWHSLRFRKQRFAELFAESNHKVLYVNPVFTILSFLQDEDTRHVFFLWLRGHSEVAPNLWLLSLPPLLPFQRKCLFINKINMKLSRWWITRAMRTVWSKEEYLQIVYQPEDVYRAPLNRECRALIYECVDEHSEYPGNMNRKERIQKLETELIAKTALTTVTGRGLLEKKSPLGPRVKLVPNGVDYEAFNAALSSPTSIPQDIASLRRPILMYVGAIMQWFDVDLVVRLAQLRRDWSIVLIGPTNLQLSVLTTEPNVYYLGKRPPRSIPGYVSAASACLIPFQVNELTRYVNPLKLFEYLAVGKPVVSVPMPEVMTLQRRGAIEIRRSAEEFVEAIDFLLNGGHDPEGCLHLARDNSWRKLFASLYHEIADSGVHLDE